MTRWIVPLVLAALALGACGSDEDDQAVAALKSQILSNNATTGSSSITDEQATCISEGAVERITVERLQDYEILGDDLEVDKSLDEVALEADDAGELAGVYVECADVEGIFEERLVAQLTRDTPAGRARVQRCVADVVTEDSVRGILAERFAQADPSSYSSLTKDLRRCRA